MVAEATEQPAFSMVVEWELKGKTLHDKGGGEGGGKMVFVSRGKQIARRVKRRTQLYKCVMS